MRRKAFLCCWFTFFALRLHGGGASIANLTLGSAIEAFSMPGWLLVMAVWHIAPLSMGHSVALALLASSLLWFFPAARVARWFGLFDAFREGKARRRSLLVRGTADALNSLNKRLFGRQKTGGWA